MKKTPGKTRGKARRTTAKDLPAKKGGTVKGGAVTFQRLSNRQEGGLVHAQAVPVVGSAGARPGWSCCATCGRANPDDRSLTVDLRRELSSASRPRLPEPTHPRVRRGIGHRLHLVRHGDTGSSVRMTIGAERRVCPHT